MPDLSTASVAGTLGRVLLDVMAPQPLRALLLTVLMALAQVSAVGAAETGELEKLRRGVVACQ
jgi:hypothetical protein